MYVYMYIYICICIHEYVYDRNVVALLDLKTLEAHSGRLYKYVCVGVGVCMRVFVCVGECMHLCIFIYTYI